MKQQNRRHGVISPEDPWRWITFSSFWGSLYYLFVCIGLIVGHESSAPQINKRALRMSLTIYLVSVISGGTVFSLLEQLIVRRSAKDQTRDVIASGIFEPTIPLQALGAAVGALPALGLVLGANNIAERVTGEQVVVGGPIRWPRAIAVMSLLAGAAGFAVTRITGWIAEDAQEAERERHE